MIAVLKFKDIKSNENPRKLTGKQLK